jgi:2-keto-4-pentenoate hydratase
MNQIKTDQPADVTVALQRGMAAQLNAWRESVLAHDLRLGWKIGFNDSDSQQKHGLAGPVLGFLRRDRLLKPGDAFVVPNGATIKAEAEVAIRVGCDVPAGTTVEVAEEAIAALAPAIEVVDVTHTLAGVEALLSGNLYHAAVLLGPEYRSGVRDPRAVISAQMRANGKKAGISEAHRLPLHLGEIVRHAADTLGRHGETLRAGDWIISGSIIEPLVVAPGTVIEIDMPPLGRVALDFVPG